MGRRVGTIRALAFCAVTATGGGLLSGCGVAPASSNPCTLKQGVLPAVAVADHMAAAPGDQQAFGVGFVDVQPGCAVPAIAVSPQSFTWVSSDPVNAPISNVAATAGVATCMGATAATISTVPVGTGTIATATLTCK
jgi:hypothetical protein